MCVYSVNHGMKVLLIPHLAPPHHLTLSFFPPRSLKDGPLSGKKKLERKSRQLLTDLPLPPELPVGISSPASTHSPAEEKKNQVPRRRPKYGSTTSAPSVLLPVGLSMVPLPLPLLFCSPSTTLWVGWPRLRGECHGRAAHWSCCCKW